MILRALHLLAAVVWAGGMISFTLVIMPALRQGLSPPQRQEWIRIIGRRYRVVGWGSIVILIVTGSLMAWNQGVVWDSGFGRVLSLKLALVGVMLVLTSLHDFVLGPRAARTENLRGVVLWLARVNLLVVIAIILCGVWLAGGLGGGRQSNPGCYPPGGE